MSHDTLEIPRLVTAPREAFLRKEETKLRSLALPLKADPAIAKELNAIEMAEDLFDIHEIAAEKQRRAGNQAWTKIHERHTQAAMQLRLDHLDRLANLLI